VGRLLTLTSGDHTLFAIYPGQEQALTAYAGR
jgi:hypothetical protein